MTDDNIIGIDGRQAVQLRKDQAEREKREEILRQKLKCLGFELQPGNAPEFWDMRADLVSIREGLSNPESGHLTHEHPSSSGLKRRHHGSDRASRMRRR
jgi:hypothetical protein